MNEGSRHNVIKVGALTFLSWRQMVNRLSRAGEIAQAVGDSPSLYVLLGRWTKWGLVKRTATYPFGYSIGTAGTRYLSNLPKWFRGDLTSIALEVAVNAGVAIWWGKPVSGARYSEFYDMTAPFQSVGNYHKIVMSPGQTGVGLTIEGSLLTLRCTGALDAVHTIERLGIKPGHELLQKLVDEGFVRWQPKAVTR